MDKYLTPQAENSSFSTKLRNFSLFVTHKATSAPSLWVSCLTGRDKKYRFGKVGYLKQSEKNNMWKWIEKIATIAYQQALESYNVFNTLENMTTYTDFWRALPFSHGGSMTIRLKPLSDSAALGKKESQTFIMIPWVTRGCS